MRLTPEIIASIRELSDESPEKIALQSKRYPDLPMAFIAQQVKARQRIRKKLPNWYANEAIVFPRSLSLEQSSSETAATYKARLLQGEVMADLTGGFGVDAFAFSERFTRVYHIERNRELSEIVAQNVEASKKKAVIKTVVGDGLDWIRSVTMAIDAIYLDPARRDSRSLKVSALEECEPNLIPNWDMLLSKAKQIGVKLSPGLDVDRILVSLPGIREIHIISVGNECKECFCLATNGFKGEPKVVCVNKEGDADWETFTFSRIEEKRIEGQYAMYSKYLYEPNASIMKAGGFKSLGREMGLSLLHPRTRFYTSEELVADFPGRVFEVLDSCELRRKSVISLFPNDQANVLARNAGISSEGLKRKLKLNDGGDLFAIGTMDIGRKRRLLKCRRI